MIERFENIRLSNIFINLTNETIHVYDKANGEIVELLPQPAELPDTPCTSGKKPIVHYIVNPEIVPSLEAFRSLDDIVIVNYINHGRHNIEIAYLSWAKDPSTNAYLFSSIISNFKHK